MQAKTRDYAQALEPIVHLSVFLMAEEDYFQFFFQLIHGTFEESRENIVL
jgi:hypothetical protein